MDLSSGLEPRHAAAFGLSTAGGRPVLRTPIPRP